MAAPKTYPDELRERVVRMVMDLRKDPLTARGAMARVSQQLAVNKDTLRNWVGHAEVDAGPRAATTTAEPRRINELEQEVRECAGRMRS